MMERPYGYDLRIFNEGTYLLDNDAKVLWANTVSIQQWKLGDHVTFRPLPLVDDYLNTVNKAVGSESLFPQNSYAQNLTFSAALAEIKAGRRVARDGWNGKGMFIFLVNGSTFSVNRPPLLGIYPAGTEVSYRSHIDMKTAQGDVVPWVASQSDLLADDWGVVDPL